MSGLARLAEKPSMAEHTLVNEMPLRVARSGPRGGAHV